MGTALGPIYSPGAVVIRCWLGPAPFASHDEASAHRVSRADEPELSRNFTVASGLSVAALKNIPQESDPHGRQGSLKEPPCLYVEVQNLQG